jgi:hypothetical protein
MNDIDTNCVDDYELPGELGGARPAQSGTRRIG